MSSMKSYQGYLHIASTSVLCASIVALGYLLHSSNDTVKSTSSIEDKLVSNDSYPEAIQDELLSRVKTFFGDAEFNKLNNSFVIVVGLGGVGSHAANMLVRSGVKNIRLIDFDQVTLSSLNRHAVATMEDVGISKAEAMKKRLLKVVPWCNITAITEMFRAVDADRLLEGNPDYVLDCIDDVNTKAELIAYCVNKNIKVFTSMGAGAKADPTKLRIATLVNCIHDPLASKIKWKLKKHSISPDDVMCIFSIENPKANLLPLDDEQKQNPQDYGVVDYLRLRVIPVLGTSPSIFGQAMSSYVLCQLAGKPYEPDSGERMSKSLRHKLRQILNNNEQRRFQSRAELDIDDDDMEFIVQIVWKNRCAITGKKFGGHATLWLFRWNPDEPPTPYNIVLIMQHVAEKIEKNGLANAGISSEIIDRVNARLAWAKELCKDDWEQSKLTEPINTSTKKTSSTARSHTASAVIVVCELLLLYCGYLYGRSS